MRQKSNFATEPPHGLWAMDSCDLSTNKQGGFDRSLMTILDDHARMGIARGSSARQTVAEVVREGRDGIGIRPCLGGKILPNRIRRGPAHMTQDIYGKQFFPTHLK